MRAQLVVIAGPDSNRTFALVEGQPRVLGRGLDADLRLADPHVSRSHCHIELKGDRAIVRDAGSSSGTLVNDRQIVEHELREGDVIQIGSTQLRFETAVNPNASTLPMNQAVHGSRLASAPTLKYYRFVRSEARGRVLVLTITQPQIMDEKTGEDLRLEILAAVNDHACYQVVIDFQNVVSVSPDVFKPLANIQARLSEKDGCLVLCSFSHLVTQVFRLGGMIARQLDADGFFVEADVEKAVLAAK
jgi:anti-anti-sigma regulatory factor